MKKSLIYLLFFFTPIIVVLLPYFITDPFKVLYHYDRYYPEDGEPVYLNTNRGYVSTQMFNQYNSIYNYDSFIFGSSRSEHYLAADWKQYLDSSAFVFHYDGYTDALYNVNRKLRYLNGKTPINNVLLCVDTDLLKKDRPITNDHLRLTPPEIDGFANYFDFHKTYLKVYIMPQFLLSYCDFLLYHQIKPYMSEWGIWDTTLSYYNLPNNEREKAIEGEIYPDSFYSVKKIASFNRVRETADSISVAVITEEGYKLLADIKHMFDVNHTNYKIIIHPMYDQSKLNPDDIKILKEIFGEEVYDFSGKTIFSADYHNYNDPMHYSDKVAKKIMSIIYHKNASAIMRDSICYNVD